MSILSLLSAERTRFNIAGGSKKRVLELASEMIAHSLQEVSADTLFSGLINRERLGSTGIGEGVAIPHCRLDNIQQAIGALIHLQTPVDFDAIDRQPVDLLFFLLVPEDACEQHLETLGQLAQAFSQPAIREQLRQAGSDAGLLRSAEVIFT